MSQMSNEEISYNEIIAWLESYYEGQEGIKTCRGLELSKEFITDVEEARKRGLEFSIDPRLPIDLVMVQSIQEIDHVTRRVKRISFYTLFWIVSSFSKSLESKLKFYQIYLSRIAEPRAVQIVMIIPATNVGKLESSCKKIAQENGFGLWKINSQKELEEICSPISFLENMEQSFADPPKDMKRFSASIRKQAPDIALFFDRYIVDAVDAVVGVTPEDVGKRYIERKVLDLVFDLRKVTCAESLKKLVASHLKEKSDDYKFVSDTFSALWSQCVPGMDYSKFLEVFEFPLFNIFALKKQHYRDHFLHQFQVFLLGLCQIDKLIAANHPVIIGNPHIEKQWLVASSFHDMAYPIQLYDFWAKEFFEESLGIPGIGVSDLRSSFVDKSLLSNSGFIINALCKTHFQASMEGNWLHEEKGLVLFLYDRITKLKHHCLLSSLFLLKQAQLNRPDLLPDLLKDIFVPASLAIALHHYKDVWKKLRNEDDEAWQNLPGKRKLRTLEFNKDPLTFLLILCDCVQEWGRPTIKYQKPEKIAETGEFFLLSECLLMETGCSITIETPELMRTQKRFKTKAKEFDRLEGFLRSSADLEFKIILLDKEDRKKEYVIPKSAASQ